MYILTIELLSEGVTPQICVQLSEGSDSTSRSDLSVWPQHRAHQRCCSPCCRPRCQVWQRRMLLAEGAGAWGTGAASAAGHGQGWGNWVGLFLAADAFPPSTCLPSAVAEAAERLQRVSLVSKYCAAATGHAPGFCFSVVWEVNCC